MGNVEGARAAGVAAMHYTEQQQMVAALRRLYVVVGGPSELTEEDVKAFVVGHDQERIDLGDVHAFARARLAPYKVPRFIEVVRDLPHTATDRLAKHRLPLERTAAEIAASAAICKNAPRMLISPLRPDINIIAVMALIPMPSSETQMTVRAATSVGALNRRTASHAIAPTDTSRKIALNKAARIELPRNP